MAHFPEKQGGFDAAVLQLLGIEQDVGIEQDGGLEQDGDRNNILARYHDKCSRALQQSRSPEVFLHRGEIAAITGEATNGTGQNVPCLVFGLNESLLKMDAAYILDFLIEDAHVQSGQPGSCHGAEVIQYVLMNLNEDRCSDQARGLRARWQQMDERMRRQGVLARFVAEVLLKEKDAGTQIEGAKGQWMLKDFFSFDVDDCSEYCYPVVWFQSISSDSQCFDGDANSERLEDQPTKVLADCLKLALLRAGVATYAVAPDRAVQRLQLLEKEALFMDATYGGVSSFGGREVLETAALEREPVAFGIGDWGRTIDPAQSDTKFAWVILPRRRPLSGGRFEQAADHVDISAIVSAPSWWKSVRLTVTTCWMDSTDLVGEADPDKLCKDPGVDQHGDQNGGYKFEVALPGNASEIMTKLRFDVLTFPYLFGQRQYQNVLEVGRKGSLIILGGRLWRSPRVIMGNQIADRIEVLPDMDGIVAHFNCVQPYPGTPGLPDRDENSTRGSGADTAGSNQTEPPDSAQRASSDQDPDSGSNKPPVSLPAPRLGFAVVWTSEGRTSNLPVEFRPYSKRVGEQAEDPCWLHEDQDGRSVESSESPSPADQPSGQDAS